MAKIICTLGKYDQRRLWKCICFVNAFDLLFKKKLSLDNKNLIWGEISLWNVFLKYTLDTIICTPRNSYE